MAERLSGNQANEQLEVGGHPMVSGLVAQRGSQEEELPTSSQRLWQTEAGPSIQHSENRAEQDNQPKTQPIQTIRQDSRELRSILRKKKSVRLDLPEGYQEKPRLPKTFYSHALTRHPGARSWPDSEVYGSDDDKPERKSLLPFRPPMTPNPLSGPISAPGSSRERTFMTREEADNVERNPRVNSRGNLVLPPDRHEIEAMERATAAVHHATEYGELSPGLLDVDSPPPSKASKDKAPEILPQSTSHPNPPESPNFSLTVGRGAGASTDLDTPSPLLARVPPPCRTSSAQVSDPRQDSVVSMDSSTRLQNTQGAFQLSPLHEHDDNEEWMNLLTNPRATQSAALLSGATVPERQGSIAGAAETQDITSHHSTSCPMIIESSWNKREHGNFQSLQQVLEQEIGEAMEHEAGQGGIQQGNQEGSNDLEDSGGFLSPSDNAPEAEDIRPKDIRQRARKLYDRYHESRFHKSLKKRLGSLKTLRRRKSGPDPN
ncbi:hypothetical protein F4810DRAFT_720421 [Camillea tinctor]|nr:hypothetical protein F4810DRAFT_720421 [Camillea tinctor]